MKGSHKSPFFINLIVAQNKESTSSSRLFENALLSTRHLHLQGHVFDFTFSLLAQRKSNKKKGPHEQPRRLLQVTCFTISNRHRLRGRTLVDPNAHGNLIDGPFALI